MNGERKGETEKEREEGRSKESKKPGLDEKEKGKETGRGRFVPPELRGGGGAGETTCRGREKGVKREEKKRKRKK